MGDPGAIYEIDGRYIQENNSFPQFHLHKSVYVPGWRGGVRILHFVSPDNDMGYVIVCDWNQSQRCEARPMICVIHDRMETHTCIVSYFWRIS